MTRVVPVRRVREISRRPPRLARAYLAETYDGIGQVVKVQMSRGAVTSAFNARIAAGDFGGGRTFPPGTPVIVFSNRGQLEVFLGNHPSKLCQETFSRVVQDSLGISEFSEIPWQQGWWWDIAHADVDGDRYIIQSNFSEADRIGWVTSSELIKYPFEMEASIILTSDPYPPASISTSDTLSIGIDWDAGTLYNNNVGAGWTGSKGLPSLYLPAELDLEYRFSRSRWEITVFDSSLDLPIENFPIISGEARLFRTEDLNGKEQRVKIRVTDPNNLDDTGQWGIYAKWWIPDFGEDEPSDWQCWQRTSNPNPDDFLNNPNFRGRNAIWIDDFGTGSALFPNVTTSSWDNLKLNQCLEPGFEPSPRVP